MPAAMDAPGGGENGQRTALVGYDKFVRHNPKSDKFEALQFHHVEIYTADATMTYKRLQQGLGMSLVAKSDLSTGNSLFSSYVLQSNSVRFVVTAPQSLANVKGTSEPALAAYGPEEAFAFIRKHGLAIRAIGIVVKDADAAFKVSTANGASGVLSSVQLRDAKTGQHSVVAEVQAYGDVVLRFISGDYTGPFLPTYERVEEPSLTYGLQRFDHVVGNVPKLLDAVQYLQKATGFHEFAEFTAEDVGTLDSGLNSVVLANNSEYVLMPINEPTFGTRRQSQIQTYLEYNEGPGVQHIALKTDDIFATMREMRARSHCGGLEFMPQPSAEYYRGLVAKVGDVLSAEQLAEVEKLGLLVDRDDQGTLLQIFTKPVGDRPTLFFEIIQRLGCEREVTVPDAAGGVARRVEQAAGCGGFGKGNFKELFKSIERYEEGLGV